MIAGPFTLALDCSAIQGSVVLMKGQQILAERDWIRGQSHAELVIPAIEEVLKTANISVSDLGLMAVCHGPGSFTGVRVGINVIKSFCYSFQIPVVLVTSLELLSEERILPGQRTIAALPAHDGSFFFSIMEKNQQGFLMSSKIGKASASELEDLKKGFPNDLFVITAPNQPWPKAQVLAKIALREAALRQTKDWKALVPLYVRASSAEEKRGKA